MSNSKPLRDLVQAAHLLIGAGDERNGCTVVNREQWDGFKTTYEAFLVWEQQQVDRELAFSKSRSGRL